MTHRLAAWAAIAALALGFGAAGNAAAAPFNDRTPADVASALTEAGASAEVTHGKTPGDPDFVSGTLDKVLFFVDFNTCEPGHDCNILLFNASWDTKDVSAVQLNQWNLTTSLCPAYLDKDGMPVLWMPVAAYGHKSRADFQQDIVQFKACLGDFVDFVHDPGGYLKK